MNNRKLKPAHSPDRPLSLEAVPEEEQPNPTTHKDKMLLAKREKPKSRLQKMTKFLSNKPPNIVTKNLEDPLPPLPPHGSAPLSLEILEPLHPPPPIPSAKRLQKLQSPKQLPSLPRQSSPSRVAKSHAHTISRDIAMVPSALTTDVGPFQTPATSLAVHSRNNSSLSDGESENGLASKLRKKRASWMSSGVVKSRPKQQHQTVDAGSDTRTSWVYGDNNYYSLEPLINCQKISELYREDADTLIYLGPQSSACNASFRVPSAILSSSKTLTLMTHGDLYTTDQGRHQSYDGESNTANPGGNRDLSIGDFGTSSTFPSFDEFDDRASPDLIANGMSSLDVQDAAREHHLYFPTGIMSFETGLTTEDTQKLVDIRNMFAFLVGKPFVATRQCPDLFRIFLRIGTLLKAFGFGNSDGSTFGEAATDGFNFYLGAYDLADVRESPEKAIKGIILGEAMRSETLYKEAFAHAVGRYIAVKNLTPIFNLISTTTLNRLERAHMNVSRHLAAANLRLTSFDFPSLFVGTASSKTSDFAGYVRFTAWKASFISFRKHVMSYYKDIHGNWPPKSSSKKNPFAEDGLNRLVLKGLYNDFCQLYNLLVDRSVDPVRTSKFDDETVDVGSDIVARTNGALRKMLSEFDRSSPPAIPPIPFDLPIVPTIATVNPQYALAGPSEQSKETLRKVTDHEKNRILPKSHNRDYDTKNPFIQAFQRYEFEQAHHKNTQELGDQRHGVWLFLYAVIQSLPLLAVDAPDVRYSDRVEYFLCQAPTGPLPWTEAAATKKNKYRVTGTDLEVEYEPGIVENSVDATYQRSHCWAVAQQWVGSEMDVASAQEISFEDTYAGFQDPMLSPLELPPGIAGGQFGMSPPSRGRQHSSETAGSSRPVSRTGGNAMKRQSVLFGLEQLPTHDYQQKISISTSPMIPYLGHPYTPQSAPGSPSWYHRNLNVNGQGGQGPFPLSASNAPPPRDPSVTRQDGHGGSRPGTASGMVPTGGNTGHTFDDIFNSMAAEKPAQGGKKEKKDKKDKKDKKRRNSVFTFQ